MRWTGENILTGISLGGLTRHCNRRYSFLPFRNVENAPRDTLATGFKKKERKKEDRERKKKLFQG